MLPSQSPRPVMLRSSSSRSRRGGLPIGKIIIGLGVLIGGWFAVKAILPVDETNADQLNGDGAAQISPETELTQQAGNAPARTLDVADQSRNADRAAEQMPTLATTESTLPDVQQPPPPAGPASTRNPGSTATTSDPDELVMGGTNTGPGSSSAGSTQPANIQPTQPANSAPDIRTTERIQKGLDLLHANRLAEGRLLLSRALASGGLSRQDAELVRSTLSELNTRLVFSPEIARDDEYALSYTIGRGDSLERIVQRMALQVDWRFIARINRIDNPRSIREGQLIKLITGPFHAVVDKSDFTLDLYLGESEAQVYVTTFRVGLGEFNSTPVGLFRVRPRSKLINPEWINPRTRERYSADDPNNPIGEHWLGLEGISDAVRDVSGYGIHGTIEPNSIGRQASMGCVRMLADDVKIIYEVLTEGASTVRIQD